MSYPGYPPGPPSGGGYPSSSSGYPPQGGPSGMPAPAGSAPYPPSGQSGPWIPGVPPAGPAGAPPPTGGFGGIGFGTGPSPYPPGPSGPPGSYPPGPPGGSYPPGPSGAPGSYPPGPAGGSYPPGPTGGSYPPGPTGGSYPPGPTGGSYPPGPSGGSYPPPASSGPPYYTAPPSQQAPGGYYNAPPPVPSSQTHHAATRKHDHQGAGGVAQATQGVASMSVGGKAQHYKEPATEGTVTAYSRFNAETDAKTLRDAMKGFGTDEKAIINVVAYRSNAQRQEIKLKFKALYGKDLIKELKGELSGHFEDVVLALLMTPREYDAFVVRNAIEGAGTDEDALIEILCSRNNQEITEIKQHYKKKYGKDVEKDVMSDTSGHFKRLMVSMLTGGREPSGAVDRQKARADAQALYKAGEARWGTDESMFNQILASKSFSHLRAVFEEYSKVCKYDIEESISREMSGDLKDGMLTIVKCVRSKPTYFAEKLYKSMKGLGTNDRVLVRVMVSRCEVDMVQIKKVFYQKYHKTLGSFIKGDTSGDYRRILMALARED